MGFMKFHRLKYPKLIILLVTFVLAYFIFLNEKISLLLLYFDSFGYFSSFIAGMLFAYGFTAAPATALFLLIAKNAGQNIFIIAFIGAVGSVIGNLLVFHAVRFSLNEEITELEHEKEVIRLEKSIPYKLRKYFLLVFIGFILVSPLPDEIAVSLFAASHKISLRTFSIMSYVFHFIGIALILFIGTHV